MRFAVLTVLLLSCAKETTVPEAQLPPSSPVTATLGPSVMPAEPKDAPEPKMFMALANPEPSRKFVARAEAAPCYLTIENGPPPRGVTAWRLRTALETKTIPAVPGRYALQVPCTSGAAWYGIDDLPAGAQQSVYVRDITFAR